MSRIAVGSRVRANEEARPSRYIGREGVVLIDDVSDSVPYKVKFLTDGVDIDIEWFDASELDVISDSARSAPTTSHVFETSVLSAFEDARLLLLERHIKYGPKNISATPYGWKVGLITRISDKLARLQHMEGDATDESRVDAFMDIANYAIIGLLNERGEWPDA